MVKKSSYTVKKVETEAEMKAFLKIFDYWHKQGLVGFVPIFILHRHKDKGELFVLKDKEHDNSVVGSASTHDNRVVGIAWIISRKRPYEFYQVKTLALSPDYHGKGVGEMFLRELVDPLHKKGSDLITSVVAGKVPAVN